MKVMHVCESFGGGVTSAIISYVKHSNGIDHYLFATVRENDATGEEHGGLFRDVSLVSRNINALSQLKEFYRKVQPDIVHAHSSYAGVIVRLMPYINSRKIVYTPHAFAFLRLDSKFMTSGYKVIEKLLSFRTGAYIGCGRFECHLAKSLNKRASVYEIVNISNINMPPTKNRRRTFDKFVVSMVGRVTEQKGFRIFADVATHCSSESVEFVWIGGGGDKAQTEILSKAGVRVTGWLNRDQVLCELNHSSLYFHSALWEGFPISILEAAHLQIPIMPWAIQPFIHEGMFTVGSVEHAIQIVSNASSGNFHNGLIDNVSYLNTNNTARRQSQLLGEAYSKISSHIKENSISI